METKQHTLKIRPAKAGDLLRIMEIFEGARAFMASEGNPGQWGPNRWPPEELIAADIRDGKSYVCTKEGGEICGTFYLDEGKDPEPTYRHIEGEGWIDESPYGVVHRIASDRSEKGIGTFCLEYAYRRCGHIRIDTHEENRPMRSLLRKLGYSERGIIYLEKDHAPRVAYEKPRDKKLLRRVWMSLLGVLICGLSVGLFKRAALGVDPFQSLLSGLLTLLPIDYGTLYMLFCALLLVISLVFDRRKIGIATLINLFLLGYVADFSLHTLEGLFPELSLGGRFLFLGAGIVIMCLASSLYFTADLGVSVYDAVALILSEKQNKIPFRLLRIATDLCCVGIGAALIFLGGAGDKLLESVGLGTIMTAFFMGPLIDFFSRKIAKPLLNR